MNTISSPREAIPTSTREGTILFPTGLPGFRKHQEFILSFPPDATPLVFLQSVAEPFPRFLLLPVPLVDPYYRFHMEPCDRELLDTAALLEDDRLYADVSLYFVVSAARNAPPTVNMLAPIAIRPSIGRGVQAVRADSVYSHAVPLNLASGEML